MNCKDGTFQMTEQIIDLLDQLDEKTYSKSLAIFSGSSLGIHFRHILDFYNCLLNGIQNDEIDYSCRERNIAVETQPLVARKAFEMINEAVKDLDPNQGIIVKADFASNNRPLVPSSIGRELMFVYDHTIHHLAIIKMGLLSAFPQIKIDEHLGVAPSTIKHQSGGQAPQNLVG